MKANVKMDHRGSILTYEVPEGTPIGARVSAPLPYFLQTDSSRLEWPNGYTGTVVGPGTYEGRCIQARVIKEEATA